ncbi:hypothetical protein PFISCL1PPCAC_12259, partial [Pristionchus fissidentatus]
SFRSKPYLDPLNRPRDGILIVEGQKLHVNKQSLAAQSSYFNALFFGGFKESNESEIEIKDVDPEDLDNLIRLTYDLDGQSMNMDNVEKMVHLAGIFDLKIVEDKAVNFLLGYKNLSIHQKLLISERLGLQKYKVVFILKYNNRENLIELGFSEEFAQLSPETIRILFIKAC